MNLILFEKHELASPLPHHDRRAAHLREVLQRRIGEPFDCGVVDGPRGKAAIAHETATGFHLRFNWEAQPPPALHPLTLLVGLPRPQTARKILLEATSLGVARMVFFSAMRSDPNYAQSTLWTSGEVRRLLMAGAEQAFCTHLPEVARAESLQAALDLTPPGAAGVALDNYEGSTPLLESPLSTLPATLAIGPERGWTPPERTLLRERSFALAHLGRRVLRAETAVAAGVAVLLAKLGCW